MRGSPRLALAAVLAGAAGHRAASAPRTTSGADTARTAGTDG
ncbi:hypothetical protein MMMB2_2187 [Mycobacterium marinum MB2]|nr:hypothetical protein MMMB2_2187 [Mycobacterium marinum MB2]